MTYLEEYSDTSQVSPQKQVGGCDCFQQKQCQFDCSLPLKAPQTVTIFYQTILHLLASSLVFILCQSIRCCNTNHKCMGRDGIISFLNNNYKNIPATMEIWTAIVWEFQSKKVTFPISADEQISASIPWIQSPPCTSALTWQLFKN